VDEEVKSLERTLKNIDEARPIDDLTVVSISNPMEVYQKYSAEILGVAG
jgi:hypothetical protein